MDEETTATVSNDRTVEQAIVTIKKGAYLLRCGRRGRPKLFLFKLSTDEKHLLWFSGQDEKKIRLNTVTEIISGQKTGSFQRKPQPDRESQSFSLIYGNGLSSLDLICKDKAQAKNWVLGLRAVISGYDCYGLSVTLESPRGVQTCVNSPAGYIRRKHNLGLLGSASDFSQVRSLCGSPALSLSKRCFSEGLYSFDRISLSETTQSQMQNVVDISGLNSPCFGIDYCKKTGENCSSVELVKGLSSQFGTSSCKFPPRNDNVLKHIIIWGGVEQGNKLSGVNRSWLQEDLLLPTLLDYTLMLNVETIGLGGKHAALVTKQGQVFCWGDGDGGRLGHKASMDVDNPKLVESLDGKCVKSVFCGEFQTFALTDSGELYGWGDSSHGGSVGSIEETRSPFLPRKLSGPLDGIHVRDVACGDWHTAILSASGQLFTYGDGTFGVLGHGNVFSLSQPKEVEALRGLRVISIACGSWHTAAIVETTADYFKLGAVGWKLFTWGDGDYGKLGHADRGRKLLPTFVAQLVDYDLIQVCCGRMLTVALTSVGAVCTMGSSEHGQLGNPKAKSKSITIVEGELKGEFVKQISSGSYHIAALTGKGNVYTWGKGANGQLGLGDRVDRHSPTLINSLRDREVLSIACGSSFSAVICLDKSISFSDQSGCSGCRMPFGFTRKKHNCYNCGVQFCHGCSSKKVVNASLAPDKRKPFRVCDSCFNQLQEFAQSQMPLKNENKKGHKWPLKALGDDRLEVGKVPFRWNQRQLFNVGNPSFEIKALKNQFENWQLPETVCSLSGGVPQWGEVPCPVSFGTSSAESSALLLSPKNQLHIKSERRQKDIYSISLREQKHSNKMLMEEVQRLRAEVRRLEKKCQNENSRIKEYQESIEEAWSLAREEAAKCKAAKELIKYLALRLNTTSEKPLSGKETKNRVDPPDLGSMSRDGAVSAPLLPNLKLPKVNKGDSLSNSCNVCSDKIRSLKGTDTSRMNSTSLEDSLFSGADSQQEESKGLKNEWVEEYEPGVYITVTILPSGHKGLKRVRFSRKRFGETEATQWWEANQARVSQKYGIDLSVT